MRKLSLSERWTAWCIFLLLGGPSPLLLISKTNAPRPLAPARQRARSGRQFFSILHAPLTAVNTLCVFPINTFQTRPPTGFGESADTSSMVVDNLGSATQASSIYFGVQGTTAHGDDIAVKLISPHCNKEQ